MRRWTVQVVLALPMSWLLTCWLASTAWSQDPPNGSFARDAIEALEARSVSAIKSAERSVVAISRVSKSESEGGYQVPNLGRLRWNARLEEAFPTDADYIPAAYGAGVVVDPAGLILTTYHVLGRVPGSEYFVWLQHRPFKAQVVAADGWMDLAILKIDAQDLQPMPLGDATRIAKGQFVLALGNPLAVARDGNVSAAWGMIANTHRRAPPLGTGAEGTGSRETVHHYGTLLQVDTRWSLGFSGGALLNLDGQMIAMTTAYAGNSLQPQAANYAIPVDDHFQLALQQLKSGKTPEFGFLGVGLQTLDARARRRGQHGAVVESVMAGTPAARADLKPGDLVTHCDSVPLYDDDDLIREISLRAAGASVRLTVLRTGSTPEMTDLLEKVPVLTKRFPSAVRPSIATAAMPRWRGLVVDDATAAPRPALMAVQLPESGGLYVAQVDPDSPAWRAGLRPGFFVSEVGGQSITTGAEFYARVPELAGDVDLAVFAAASELKTHTVSP